MKLTRREILSKSTLVGGTALIGGLAYGSACDLTPAQTEGPFYPITPHPDTDWDLTRVNGRDAAALGEPVTVRGRILNLACKPVEGALVEIWQACASGRYDHPQDPNPSELDPNFQYWGRVRSDRNGNYLFKTVVPGAYPASDTWIRPAHIHFKVSPPKARSFVTQMYFAGSEHNETDLILNALKPAQRKLVVIESDVFEGMKSFYFEITLNLSGQEDSTPELD
jgi:protocatechuate 3,4-dioxygenase beta subunit